METCCQGNIIKCSREIKDLAASERLPEKAKVASLPRPLPELVEHGDVSDIRVDTGESSRTNVGVMLKHDDRIVSCSAIPTVPARRFVLIVVNNVNLVPSSFQQSGQKRIRLGLSMKGMIDIGNGCHSAAFPGVASAAKKR